MKRGGPLPRRTALIPGKTLARSPWRRKPMQLADNSRTTRGRRTGFDRATKAVIFDRDRHSCVIAVECDGRPGTAQTVHHLENRGMGGAPWLNTVTNGIACCHLDNAWVEDHPAQAQAASWKRARGTTGPVRYPDGQWWLLSPDGTRRPA